MSSIGTVISSSPSKVLIEIRGLEVFESNKSSFQVGRFLKVEDGNDNFAIAVIKNIDSTHDDDDGWTFIIEAVPAGALISEGEFYKFKKGTPVLPVPTEPVHVMDTATLDNLFASDGEYNFPIGTLSNNHAVTFCLDGDRFFSKHIGVVGSTGSGKSCAVSSILQGVVGIRNNEYVCHGRQNNSHIVIFDLHSEYSSAFKIMGESSFTLNDLSVDELQLPYWLMNSEELESMFIESNENNSHNQIAIFKKAVILNKSKYNKGLKDVTYDTPCYFSIVEVINYIDNVDREVIGKLEGEGKPKLANGTIVDNPDIYFGSRLEFISTSTAKDTKASNGPFNGEFTRFVSRLETRMADERLRFLLKPEKDGGIPYNTEDFHDLLKQFIGYMNRSNVTIVDMSGVPFEVLSVTVSLISRLIFDFCFHYSKLQHADARLNDIPVLLVCEEAHNYVPASDASLYKASRKSIERIAKEGRKYGLSLMIVSQRPSEVSPTIYSQCSNFIALRLTNKSDQNYIKGLLPENTSGVAETLPSLGQGEALVVGDASIMPTLVQLPKPNPEPKSASVNIFTEWSTPWVEPSFERIIKRWRKESQ